MMSKYKIAQFYGTPKIHKSPMKLRPVVSKCGTELEVMSKILDSIFQKIIRQSIKQRTNPSPHDEVLLPAYLKDSWELLSTLKKLPKLSPEDRLVTVDATAMYTNINTGFALEIMERWFI